MDSGQARKIFTDYAAALAYVEVESPNGDLGIGSAFHVGEGVFVTARHVVEGKRVNEICMTVPLDGTQAETATTFLSQNGERVPVHDVNNGVLQLKSGPFFHSHSDIDVAVFRVHDIDPHTPIIPLGSHLDDWLGRSDFVLTEAVVLGYPPIPMTTTPVLVGARAEVNAQVDLYDSPHVHFILSATARGGFSGGVAFSEYGFALGLVTRSLLVNDGSSESGYMSVLTIEPIYECLANHKMLPDDQAEMWDGLWNTQTVHFYSKETFDPGRGNLVIASIGLFDDGKNYHLTICCDDNSAFFNQAMRTATEALQVYRTTLSEIRAQMHRLHIVDPDASASATILETAQHVARFFLDHGYRTSFTSHGEDTVFWSQSSEE